MFEFFIRIYGSRFGIFFPIPEPKPGFNPLPTTNKPIKNIGTIVLEQNDLNTAKANFIKTQGISPIKKEMKIRII